MSNYEDRTHVQDENDWQSIIQQDEQQMYEAELDAMLEARIQNNEQYQNLKGDVNELVHRTDTLLKQLDKQIMDGHLRIMNLLNGGK